MERETGVVETEGGDGGAPATRTHPAAVVGERRVVRLIAERLHARGMPPFCGQSHAVVVVQIGAPLIGAVCQ